MYCYCSPHHFRTINYSDSRLEILCETAWGLRTNAISVVPLLKECGLKVTLEFFLWNRKPSLSKRSPPFEVFEDLSPYWKEPATGRYREQNECAHSNPPVVFKVQVNNIPASTSRSSQLSLSLKFPERCCVNLSVLNLLKPTVYVMHQQFNIQQLYVLLTL